MKMLLAAGMARIAHKDGLSNVVVASTDAEVARRDHVLAITEA